MENIAQIGVQAGVFRVDATIETRPLLNSSGSPLVLGEISCSGSGGVTRPILPPPVKPKPHNRYSRGRKETPFDSFIRLQSCVQKLHTTLGNPLFRDLAVRKSALVEGELVPELLDFLFSPQVQIKNVPPKYLNYPFSEGTIVVSRDDLIVEYLPRTYEYKFLKEGVEFYIVDPVLDDTQSQIVGGIRCQLVHIEDSNPLSWSLILKKLHDQEPLEPVELVT